MGRAGEHAVYPGTFDPVTPGHLDVIGRARHLFARVTVLVAVNGGKQPSGAPSDRAARLRRQLPADWGNVSAAAWGGLTAAFCRQHGAGVIIRGVRNGSDLLQEYQLAAMNEALGITTLLLPAQPHLAAVSSTGLRGLGAFPGGSAGLTARQREPVQALARPAGHVPSHVIAKAGNRSDGRPRPGNVNWQKMEPSSSEESWRRFCRSESGPLWLPSQ